MSATKYAALPSGASFEANVHPRISDGHICRAYSAPPFTVATLLTIDVFSMVNATANAKMPAPELAELSWMEQSLMVSPSGLPPSHTPPPLRAVL